MAIYYNISGDVVAPITLPQAKRQLRIDDIVDHEDEEITDMIVEATEIAEDYLGIYLMERSIEILASDFITEVEEKFKPITAVASVDYKDLNDNWQSLPTTAFDLDNINKQDKVLFYDEDALMAITDLKLDGDKTVRITGKVGFGADIPKSIVRGIKLLISYLYEHRNDSADMKVRASQNILRSYKQWV